ncbi:hypothetical protein E2C01_025260 [Portunus trituberculatus]|uniref:Uncharacterized protein n=1 Tax=Portunus trituberculatus TaxID=210409 RepID=A0A5B7EFA2_PORTR|nr:hypothetical protein [Portunus trituberculatus]
MTPDVQACEAHPFSLNNHISKTRGVGKQETILILFRVAVVRRPIRADVAQDEQRKVPLMTRAAGTGSGAASRELRANKGTPGVCKPPDASCPPLDATHLNTPRFHTTLPQRAPSSSRATPDHEDTAILLTQTMLSITLLSQLNEIKVYTLLHGRHTNATLTRQLLSNLRGRVMRGARRDGAGEGIRVDARAWLAWDAE